MAEREKFIYGYHEEGFDIPGCVANGISEEIASKIYDQMIDFAKYAFNKSHAACYAAIAMQTAYLKAHYPLDFASGLLTSVMDKTDKLAVYMNEYKKKGLKLLPPNVNTSDMSFTIDGDALCYGLASIKGIGENAAKDIIKERKNNGTYDGFVDFIKRNLDINKSVLENLIKSGAFDFTEYTRKAMLLQYETVLKSYKEQKKKSTFGQMTFADFLDKDSYEYNALQPHIENCLEFSDEELLHYEKEATGFYISKHPMDSYEKYLSWNKADKTISFMPDEDGDYSVPDETPVKVAGLITKVRVIFTKKNEPMAFVTIEDQISSIDIVVFPRTYQKYASILNEDTPIFIVGKTSINDRGLSIIADRILNLKEIPQDIWILVADMKSYHDAGWIFKKFIKEHAYNKFESEYDPVNFVTRIAGTRMFRSEGQIEASPATSEDAKKLFGENNVSFADTYIF